MDRGTENRAAGERATEDWANEQQADEQGAKRNSGDDCTGVSPESNAARQAAAKGMLNMVDHNNSGESSKSPEVDIAEAARFLRALDPAATKFTFQRFDDDGDRGNKDLVRVLHGTLAEHFDELKRLNDRGAGIFVTVNETDFRGRSAENITRVRALWVDLDGAPLEPVLADARKVHIVVDTSPGRWHAYWLVTGVAPDQFSAKMKALIALYNSDTSVHDLPRVMRLPGFIHRKGAPHLVRVTTVNGAPPYIGSSFPSQESEPHQPADGDGTAGVNFVAAAVAVIPNPDLDWGSWCSMVMAIYRATSGSDAGLEIAKAYSSKSVKNDDQGTEKKWRELDSSPPDRIGAGTLFFKADEVNPRWRALVGIPIKQAIKVAELAALPPFQYEQRRKQAAKDLGPRRDDGRDNEEMRGIMNAGHGRGGTVIRVVGERHEPRMFKVFAPLAYAWLVRRGVQVAQTLEDRSITIELRRRLPNEEIERLRSNRTGHLEVLGCRAARWVTDHEPAVEER